MSREFIMSLGTAFEVVPVHEDGSNCNHCVTQPSKNGPYTKSCSVYLCGKGHLILVSPDDDEFALARLKGEV